MPFWIITCSVLMMMSGNLLLRSGMLLVQDPKMPRRAPLALLGSALRNWRVLFGIALLFISVIAWISGVVMWRMEWSYTALGLSYIATVVFAWWFLGETMTLEKMIGTIIIVIGTLLIIRYNGF